MGSPRIQGYKLRGLRCYCPTQFRRRERILRVEAPQPRQSFHTISPAYSFANMRPVPGSQAISPSTGRIAAAFGEQLLRDADPPSTPMPSRTDWRRQRTGLVGALKTGILVTQGLSGRGFGSSGKVGKALAFAE